MTKQELKKTIQKYSKIEHALKGGVAYAEATRIGRTKVAAIRPWMYRLPEILRRIAETEKNGEIVRIIEYGIRLGQKDRAVMRAIPVSESTFYRWKNKLTDKIYELLIEAGEVTDDEILSESIE